MDIFNKCNEEFMYLGRTYLCIAFSWYLNLKEEKESVEVAQASFCGRTMWWGAFQPYSSGPNICLIGLNVLFTFCHSCIIFFGTRQARPNFLDQVLHADNNTPWICLHLHKQHILIQTTRTPSFSCAPAFLSFSLLQDASSRSARTVWRLQVEPTT